MGAPSKEATVFLVILGCVVVVLMGYSMHRIATNGFADEKDNEEIPYEQRQYMRELRLKHVNFLGREARGRDVEMALPIREEK
ncbi:hypothetical protein BDV25DRAFT_12578 [Aspergillus avenaceus]|uniref:Uncharacterized protein n=1 Tax=Aspergillus avenaceus TaxID=36643 RepID=A0A5N6TQR8_ASPAV|nr:hypothetical protein BDV25DRAFT_12578 [Aspergillus avenaceus]